MKENTIESQAIGTTPEGYEYVFLSDYAGFHDTPIVVKRGGKYYNYRSDLVPSKAYEEISVEDIERLLDEKSLAENKRIESARQEIEKVKRIKESLRQRT